MPGAVVHMGIAKRRYDVVAAMSGIPTRLMITKSSAIAKVEILSVAAQLYEKSHLKRLAIDE